MSEIIVYVVLAVLGFGVLNAAWMWLFLKAEASRMKAKRMAKQPASVIMGAKFQFEPSGD